MFTAKPQNTTGHVAQKICVVLVIDDLGYGGAERQLIELANNLDTARFDAHVCSLSDHVPLAADLEEADRRLHVVKMKHGFDFIGVLRLARLLRKVRADIVQAYQFKADIICRLAGRMAGTAAVIGAERNANRVIRRYEYLSLRLTRRWADIIIANSNMGATSNGKIFRRPASDYRVVPNGVDTDRFRPAKGETIREKLAIPIGCPVIGVFANFKKQKNHSMLFRAFKLVLDSIPNARLLLIGDQPVSNRGALACYLAELNSLVDELGIRHACMFLMHRKDVECLYPACDITVLPSLHEGVPNVLLESMACGIPVVATNVCDNQYIVREGETGYLVGAGDEAAMANRMALLLSNAALRQSMGYAARKWVLQEFSIGRLAQKTEAVYLEILHRKTASRQHRVVEGSPEE